MIFKTKIDQYFVVGYPIKHSISPSIHNDFAKKTKQKMKFNKLKISPDNLYKTFDRIKNKKHIKGLSITAPHKEKSFEYCDTVDDLAQKSRSVSNIIITADRKFHGVNFDGIGLINDISLNLKYEIKNKSILLIGAGGATKNILWAIIQQGPSSITIVNRTYSKIEPIIALHKNDSVNIYQADINNINQKFDIVINATSININNKIFPIKKENFSSNAIGYDLSYRKNGTLFTRWCKEQNIEFADGTGMLKELSKIIFQKWRNIKL